MVLIIDGEIVADNDPRAIARRGQGRGGAPQAAPRQHAAPTPQRAPAHGAADGAPANPLDTLAGAMGIGGQSVRIPAMGRIPARDVPLIVVLLISLLTLFAGWRVLAVGALLHVVSGLSEAQPARPPQQRPAATGR